MASRAAPPVHVALLRGINVGGRHKLPMAALRELCAELGWAGIATHVQSGNVVFRARGTPAALAGALAGAVAERFGFAAPAVVRAGSAWLRYAAGGAFPDAEADRAKMLHLALAARAPGRGAAAALLPYCTAGERVAVVGDALWIDYQGGVARSKLTSAVLDRVVGAPVTARNWTSVQAIAALVHEA